METLALKNKPLFQATLGDLVEVMKEQLGFISEKGKDGRGNTNPSSEKRYVYGLFGISKLFGCSQATAQRIKSSGVIDAAISQNGKIIVVDADLALDLLRVSNKNGGVSTPSN